MKLLFDFLPGVLFIIALYAYDIYVATAVVMVAMALQVGLMLVMRKAVSGVQWFTLGVILVFGTATLVLHDPLFVKWKPTVINWMFAALLLAGPVLFKKNFIRALMGEHITAPDKVWSQLNLAWALFLTVLGGLNLVVAFNTSDKTWGLFKVFGLTGLLVAFSLAQVLVLGKYVNPELADGDQAPKP